MTTLSNFSNRGRSSRPSVPPSTISSSGGQSYLSLTVLTTWTPSLSSFIRTFPSPKSKADKLMTILYIFVPAEYRAYQTIPFDEVVVPGDVNMGYHEKPDDPHDKMVDKPQICNTHNAQRP